MKTHRGTTFTKGATLLLALLLFMQAAPAFGASSPKKSNTADYPASSHKVIVLLAPFVTWKDITPQTTPHLYQASRTSAIGDINARSRAKEDSGEPSMVEGALTISSGAWAFVDNSAYSAYDTNEKFESSTAGRAYGRIMGTLPQNREVVYLGLPKIELANKDNGFKVVPGTLGQAIEDAGGATAAIGNSDLGYSSDAQRLMRPAGIAAMNTEGTTRYGLVSEKILKQDDASPYGVRTDTTKLKSELSRVYREMDSDKPGLIVLDSGDLYRASNYASSVTPTVAADTWNKALSGFDDLYQTVHERYPDDTVIVAAQASKDTLTQKEGFGPIIVSSMRGGLLTSDSTQRAGLVTNLDLSSTILDVLGITPSVDMLGSEMRVTNDYSLGLTGKMADSAANRIDLLEKMNATALAIENNRASVINIFIGLTVFILVIGAFIIMRGPKHWRGKRLRLASRAIKLLILAVLSVPAASWCMFFFYRWPSTPLQVTAQLLLTAAGIWLLTVALSWRFGTRIPLIFLAGFTTIIIVVDQLLGAPASFTSFFGYSPIAAARFYGVGNEGAAVLFGAVVIGIVLALDQWPHARWVPALKKWGIPVIGFITMFICAAPFLGANVGVAAWATVGFVLMWFLVNDKKITWKSVLLMFAIVVVVVGAFIGIDRFGSGAETHLARSINSAEAGGIAQLWDIVVRKAQTNLRVLTHTNLVWILLAVILFLALMRWRPSGEFAQTLKRNPMFAHGMTTILVTGFVAYFTEDSGVVLPALMVLYLGCGIVWIMLDMVNTFQRGGATARLESAQVARQSAPAELQQAPVDVGEE